MNPRVQACLPLFNRGKVLAVVVTVQVQLLVPEYIPLAPLFTHYPIVWTVNSSVVGDRVLPMLKRGLL